MREKSSSGLYLSIWILSVGIVPVLASLADAQAWVPAKGEGDYSIVYQNLYTRDHLDPEGNKVDAGRVRLQGVIQAVDFGLTDKLSVTGMLPLFAGKFAAGQFGKPHLLPIDNGNYHGGLQDFRLAVRYQVRQRPLALTPFLGISFPGSHYEHFAHSAIGADMWELGLGINAGRRLDPWLPNAYFQARYTYVITENVTIPQYGLSIRPDRSRYDGEFGYFLTSRITLRAIASAQITHGGLDQSAANFPLAQRTATDPRWTQHDRIGRINYVNVGAGVSVPITHSVDAFALYATKAWAINGHALNDGISVGLSWSFRAPWAEKKIYFQEEVRPRAKLNDMKLCH